MRDGNLSVPGGWGEFHLVHLEPQFTGNGSGKLMMQNSFSSDSLISFLVYFSK